MTKDITLCRIQTYECKKKDTCLRYKQEPRAKWQNYLVYGVVFKSKSDVDECRWYWEMPN